MADPGHGKSHGISSFSGVSTHVIDGYDAEQGESLVGQLFVQKACINNVMPVWIWTRILSPDIRYFVAILRFVAIHTLFGRLLLRKGLYKSKTVQYFLDKKCTIKWYILYFIMN